MADRTEQVKTSGKSIWFRCPQSETCGGCQLLKLPYSAQLRKKQEWVESLLSAYGSVQPIIGMENPKHYRNKVHAVFALDRAMLDESKIEIEPANRSPVFMQQEPIMLFLSGTA